MKTERKKGSYSGTLQENVIEQRLINSKKEDKERKKGKDKGEVVMNWKGEEKSVKEKRIEEAEEERGRRKQENKKTRKIIIYVVCYVIWYTLGKY